MASFRPLFTEELALMRELEKQESLVLGQTRTQAVREVLAASPQKLLTLARKYKIPDDLLSHRSEAALNAHFSALIEQSNRNPPAPTLPNYALPLPQTTGLALSHFGPPVRLVDLETRLLSASPRNDLELLEALQALRYQEEEAAGRGGVNRGEIVKLLLSEDSWFLFSERERLEARLELGLDETDPELKLKLAQAAVSQLKDTIEPSSVRALIHLAAQVPLQAQERRTILRILRGQKLPFSSTDLRQNIKLMLDLLRVDEGLTMLQIQQIIDFFSRFNQADPEAAADTSSATRKPDTSSLSELVDVLEAVAERYSLALKLQETKFESVLEFCTELGSEHGGSGGAHIDRDTLFRLLSFFTRHYLHSNAEFMHQFWNQQLLGGGESLASHQTRLLELLEACAARLRVHQASFDNFQFTIRHKNIASSMLIEPQIDLITAIFHQFLQSTPSLLPAALEPFRLSPELALLCISSPEMAQRLRLSALQNFRAHAGSRYESIFRMMAALSPLPLQPQQAQHFTQILDQFITKHKRYKKPEQALKERVSLFRLAEYNPQLAQIISTRDTKQLMDKGLLSRLSDRFVREQSSEVLRYLFYLQQAGIKAGVSGSIKIEPKLLIGDAVSKYIKMQLRGGSLNESAVAGLLSNLETLDLVRVEFGAGCGGDEELAFEPSEAQRAHLDKYISQNQLLIMKAIFIVHRKNPALIQQRVNSSVGFLIAKVFARLTLEQKIAALQILGKHKLDTYPVELVDCLLGGFKFENLDLDTFLRVVKVWPPFVRNQALLSHAASLPSQTVPVHEHIPMISALASMGLVHSQFIETAVTTALGLRGVEERAEQLAVLLEKAADLGYGLKEPGKVLAGLLETFKSADAVPTELAVHFWMSLLFGLNQDFLIDSLKQGIEGEHLLPLAIYERVAPYSLKELLDFGQALFRAIVDGLNQYKILYLGPRKIRYLEAVDTDELLVRKVRKENSLRMALEAEAESSASSTSSDQEDEQQQVQDQQYLQREARQLYSTLEVERRQKQERVSSYERRRLRLLRYQQDYLGLNTLRKGTHQQTLKQSIELKTFLLLSLVLEAEGRPPFTRSMKYKEGLEHFRRLMILTMSESSELEPFITTLRKYFSNAASYPVGTYRFSGRYLAPLHHYNVLGKGRKVSLVMDFLENATYQLGSAEGTTSSQLQRDLSGITKLVYWGARKCPPEALLVRFEDLEGAGADEAERVAPDVVAALEREERGEDIWF